MATGGGPPRRSRRPRARQPKPHDDGSHRPQRATATHDRRRRQSRPQTARTGRRPTGAGPGRAAAGGPRKGGEPRLLTAGVTGRAADAAPGHLVVRGRPAAPNDGGRACPQPASPGGRQHAEQQGRRHPELAQQRGELRP
ncbi:hypothetical protein AB0L31_28585, partial [Streptomyces sp. NPDC052535]